MGRDSHLIDEVYLKLRDCILNGTYPPGSRLPSIRTTAQDYCVSRGTVERAYLQLMAEGFVEPRNRSGYYVENIDLDSPGLARLRQSDVRQRDSGLGESEGLEFPYAAATTPYDFSYLTAQPGTFPMNSWRKLINAVLSSSDIRSIVRYGDPFGDYDLRKAISRYLFASRSVRCAPEQVIINPGFADGLDRLLKLFDPSSDIAVCEEPCLWIARSVFLANKFTLKTFSCLDINYFLEKVKSSNARLLYITPSHQFPTGSTMPIAERLALLDWANKNGAYIIEDDYDSEFRYGTRAIPSLQSLDAYGRVIYTGSFSKTLLPTIRVNYWVLPQHILELYREEFSQYPCAVSWLTQRVLSNLFTEGQWEQHLRRYVKINSDKRRELIDSLGDTFDEAVHIRGANAGLHLWAHLDGCGNASDLIEAAKRRGVIIYPASPFYYDNSHADLAAFLIGHSKIELKDIRPGIKLLGEAWKESRGH